MMKLLRRSRFHSSILIGVLSMGIGAAVATLELGKRVILQWVPIRDAGAFSIIYMVHSRSPQTPSKTVSLPRALTYREQATSWEGVAIVEHERTTLLVGTAPTAVGIARISPEFFSLLGVQPALGVLFQNSAQPDEQVIYLSYYAWVKYFGSDIGVIGRTVNVGGENCAIAGVVARDYDDPFDSPRTDVYRPKLFRVDAGSNPLARPCIVIGKRKAGVSPSAALAELSSIKLETSPAFAPMIKDQVPQIAGLGRSYGIEAKYRQWLILGAALLLYLIACLNAAGLYFIRFLSKRNDLAIMRALGASNWTVCRSLMGEIVIAVFCLSVPLALVVAHTVFPVIGSSTAGLVTETWSLSSASLALALLLGLFAAGGLIAIPFLWMRLPEWASLRVNNTLGNESTPAVRRWQRIALALQVGFCVLLLVSAALMKKSVQNLEASPLGFSPEKRFAITVDQAPAGAVRRLDLSGMEAWLQTLPEVGSTAQSFGPPLAAVSLPVEFPGRGKSPAAECYIRPISSGYFATLGIPILLGADFLRETKNTAQTIVSASLARRYFGLSNPIGQVVIVLGKQLEIIGVAADTATETARMRTPPLLYVPLACFGFTADTLLLQTPQEPRADFAGRLRTVAFATSPSASISVEPLIDLVRDTYRRESRLSSLLGLVAPPALLLCVLGIFSLVSFEVAQRKTEMGIRLALGAGSSDVFRAIAGKSVAWFGAGAMLGLGGAAFAATMLNRWLFGVAPLDPAVFLLAVVPLFASAAAALIAPLSQALRIDPACLLRNGN